MKRLYSPWRMDYIQNKAEEQGCIFCSPMDEEDGPRNLIIHRGPNAFVILNRFPYNNGHLMVVPCTHTSSLVDLNPETVSEMMLLVQKALRVLQDTYGAENFNVGVNIGEAAGAGVQDHIHMHVLPRWAGDTNFMSTVGETRVLPETLAETFSRIQSSWEKLD